MKRVPLAKLAFKDFSNTALVNYANKHRLAIAVAPGLTNFPDIPADAATLATLIDNYRLTLAAAYKGTKTETAAKDSAKAALIFALQANWNYVNQFGQRQAGNFLNYDTSAAFLATSGFDITIPASANFDLSAPVIRSITSPSIGQIKIILNKFSKSGKQRTKKVPGVQMWEIKYRTSAVGVTPAGPWQITTSTAYFKLIEDLSSGSYDIQIRGIGRDKSISAYTSIRSIVVL